MRYLKFLAIALLIVACSRLSESHYNDLKADEMTEPAMTFDDAVKDGYFKYSHIADSICGIEDRGTDTWCDIASGKDDHELYTDANFYRLALNPVNDSIFLVDNLTGEIVADLTNNSELQSIILKDNQ